MKKLTNQTNVNIKGGICTLPPNSNFPFPCFNSCQIAQIASGGNYPFFCIE